MQPNTHKFVNIELDDTTNIATVTKILTAAGVRIDVLCVQGGQATVLPNNVETAVDALGAEGIDGQVTDFIAHEGPGLKQLSGVLGKLSAAGITVEQCLFTANRAYLHCADQDAALQVIQGAQIATV